MRAILINGYGYSESVEIVEAKETAKFYIVDGVRYTKSQSNNRGSIAEKRGSGRWGSSNYLYPLDNQYALGKLDDKRHKILIYEIERRLKKSISKDQAKQIAEILGITD